MHTVLKKRKREMAWLGEKTPREFALELEVAQLTARLRAYEMDVQEGDISDDPFEIRTPATPSITLPRQARVTGGFMPEEFRYHVIGISEGPNENLEASYYISGEMREEMANRGAQANILGMLHERWIRMLAESLRKDGA